MVQATALKSTADLGVDNTDMETVLCGDSIDGEDLQAGRFDFAEVKIFIVDYLHPNAWQIKLLRGTIGEVRVGKHRSTCELRSLTQRLKQRIGRSHEVSCHFELGDAKCRVDLNNFTVSSAVKAVINQSKFEDDSRTEEQGWFKGGKLTWTSGDNAGLSMEVRGWNASLNRFVLQLAMPFPISGQDFQLSFPDSRT